MIDLPPITLALFNEIASNLSEQDKNQFNQYRLVQMSIMSQYFIEIMRKKEKLSFDEFIAKAVLHYGFHITSKKRSEAACEEKNQKKSLKVL